MVGSSAGYNNQGSFNVLIGALAGSGFSSASHNTVVGNYAFSSNANGSYNIIIGDSAGYTNQGSGNILIGNNAGYSETASNKLIVANSAGNATMYADLSTRQVLFGKKVTAGYIFSGNRTLNVIGGIIADSLRLAPVTNWADFVFDDDYKLPTLSEVESFIKANRHLRGVPSGQEILQSGFNVSEMNVTLLQKVEELTLYMIEQQKRMNAQQKQIDELLNAMKAEGRN
jgi:hypothetical protein